MGFPGDTPKPMPEPKPPGVAEALTAPPGSVVILTNASDSDYDAIKEFFSQVTEGVAKDIVFMVFGETEIDVEVLDTEAMNRMGWYHHPERLTEDVEEDSV